MHKSTHIPYIFIATPIRKESGHADPFYKILLKIWRGISQSVTFKQTSDQIFFKSLQNLSVSLKKIGGLSEIM